MNDDKYLDAELKLAQLLGYSRPRLARGSQVGSDLHYAGRLVWVAKLNGNDVVVPQWTRDWGACGPLMVEHGVWPSETFIGCVSARWGIDLEVTEAQFSDHPDKDTATRYAIVQAVIAKLEQQ